MKENKTPIVALVLAVVFGGFCLVAGAWKALIERGQGEYGIEWIPGDNWSYLWVGIAATILGVAAYFLIRRIRSQGK